MRQGLLINLRFVPLSAMAAMLFGLLIVASSCGPKPSAQEKHFAGQEPVRVDYAPSLELRPAYQLLRERHYDEARTMLQNQLKSIKKQPLRDETIGLVTATYYGAGMDRDGLAFLCTAYGGLPADDHRFLFQAHAHIRRIREKEGLVAALTAAAQARNACRGRSDFADIWASIPLVLMENLHDHMTRTNIYGGYYTDEHDEAELSTYIEAYKRGQDAPFAEYAFYMMRRYDEHVKTFPQSKFRDLSMAARARDNPDQPEFLAEFLKAYPNSLDREDVLYAISKYVLDNEGAVAYGAFIKNYGLNGNNFNFEHYASVVQEETNALFDKGQYQAGIDRLTEGRKNLQRCQGDDDCALRIKSISGDINNAKRLLLGIDDLPPAEIFKRLLVIRKELYWDSVAFNILTRMVDSKPMTSEDRGKALYLLGRMGWGDNSDGYYQQLIANYPDHPLADDAMAELGLSAETNNSDDEALRLYDLVALSYPGRNAVDDALWHKAHILSSDGDDAQAMAIYAQIAAFEGQNRLELAARRLLSGESEPAASYADYEVPSYEASPDQTAAAAAARQARAVLTMQNGATLQPVPADYVITGADCGPNVVELDANRIHFLTSNLGGEGTDTLEQASPGAYCDTVLKAELKEVPLDFTWEDKLFCRIKRSPAGPFVADGACVRRDEALAIDPPSRAVLRSRNFSGLGLAVHSGVSGDGEERAWSSTIKIQTAPKTSAGYKAGIRENWDILEICGSPVTFDAGTLGRAEPAKTCVLTFARYPDHRHPDKIDYVTCKARITLSSVEVRGFCRRRHSLLDVFLNLFGA